MLAVAAVVAIAVAMPGTAKCGNREVAEQIGQQLRDSGQLVNYSINVKYKDGTAWLAGRVSSPEQAATAVELARGCPQVADVVSQLQISGDRSADSDRSPGEPRHFGRPIADRSIRAASAEASPVPFEPKRLIPFAARSKARRVSADRAPSGVVRRVDHVVEYPAEAGYGPPAGMTMNVSGRPLPAYVHTTPGGAAPARYDQPFMPNYAWPSYAAYPNYAALTYPKQYSPTVWPYIGPFYPYPQVPLGWRKVTLEWDDGWWFLDFKDDPSNCWQDCCN
jgi:hypothetical protein